MHIYIYVNPCKGRCLHFYVETTRDREVGRDEAYLQATRLPGDARLCRLWPGRASAAGFDLGMVLPEPTGPEYPTTGYLRFLYKES